MRSSSRCATWARVREDPATVSPYRYHLSQRDDSVQAYSAVSGPYPVRIRYTGSPVQNQTGRQKGIAVTWMISLLCSPL